MKQFQWISSKRFLISLAVGLVITILLSSISALAIDCRGIRSSVLRLHIMANSDTKADQDLKLAVRNRILSMDTALFGQAHNRQEAEATAKANLPKIRETALDEIHRRGYSYDVKVEAVSMYFSTREYDHFTLPAGKYDAVRVIIGTGKGHNWWCVLYPPLCLPAASQKSEKLNDVLTPQEYRMVQGKHKYNIKFASVELFERIKNDIFRK